MLHFICVFVEGFEELTQEDQILLIKHGSFPVMLARYTNLVSEKTMFLPLMAFRVPRYFPNLRLLNVIPRIIKLHYCRYVSEITYSQIATNC